MESAIIFVYILVGLWIVSIVWAVNDIDKYPHKKKFRKLVWTNIVIIFPFAGLIMYHVMGKKNLEEA